MLARVHVRMPLLRLHDVYPCIQDEGQKYGVRGWDGWHSQWPQHDATCLMVPQHAISCDVPCMIPAMMPDRHESEGAAMLLLSAINARGCLCLGRLGVGLGLGLGL